MDQRLSLVTLAVEDVSRSRRFYEALGWETAFQAEEVAFFQLNGMVFGLFDRREMAKDQGTTDAEIGVGGVALAYNVASRDAVDDAMREAQEAGARIVKPPEEKPWGGYSGYFADPDGHPWEVAWNPDWSLGEDGAVRL